MRSELGRAVRRAMRANGVTRRRFIAGASALALAGCARATTLTAPVMVIGGGLAGLSAALTLTDAGYPVQVYEASDRLGGRVKTGVLGDGLLVEEGAEFIDADHTEVQTLCRRFGLDLFNRAQAQAPTGVPRTLYWLDGRRQDPAVLARLLAPLARRIEADLALLEEDEAAHAPRIDALSANAYLDAIPLDPRARWIAETMIRTEYGVEPQDSSALQLVYSLPGVDTGGEEAAEAFTLAGGNQRLAEAIAAALRVAPILNRPMGPGDLSRGGAIIALPPTALAPFATQMPLAAQIGRQSLGRNEKLILGFRGRPWRQGVFANEAMVQGASTTIWDATLRQESPDGALSFFLGGARAPLSPADALAELAPILPGVQTTGEALTTTWRENPLIGGAYASFRPGEMTDPARVYWGRGRSVIAGQVAFAGEHVSESHYGFMEGAVRTGRMAAEAVLRVLSP